MSGAVIVIIMVLAVAGIAAGRALAAPRLIARTPVRSRLAAARARAAGHRPAIPHAVAAEVWGRCRGRCQHCGMANAEHLARYGERLHMGHIVPYSRGGPDAAGNLQLECRAFNLWKGNRI